MIAILYISLYLFLLLLGWSLVTLLHELGHAIPALLFTEGKVLVYVGTELMENLEIIIPSNSEG